MTKRVTYLVVLSAFCPYLLLSVGLRVDHIVVYGLAYVAIHRFLAQRQKLSQPIAFLMIAWLMPLITILTITFFGGTSFSSQLVADLDNLLQPVALMTLFLFLSSDSDDKTRLVAACKAVMRLMFLNTLWIFAGFYTDTTWINKYFWSGEVASLAATNGRFSGIFNQPVEAGVAYSLALFAWLYLSHYQKINKRRIITLVGLLVGGFLTVSKVFLFGGLPLFVFWMLKHGIIRRKLLKIAAFSVAFAYIPYQYLSQNWFGFDYLLRFFTGSQGSFLSLMTAGRFGAENASQEKMFLRVWEDSPIIGRGLGSTPLVDSSYFHMFVSGGLLALLGFIFFLLVMLHLTLKYWRSSPESWLLRYLSLLVIFGGFGAPVLSLNRSSILLWCMLCCTALVLNRETGSFYLQ